MPADPNVRLVIGDHQLEGWTSYEIESDLLQPADAFRLELENAGGRLSAEVRRGSTCQIWLDAVQLLTGYIDEVSQGGDAQQGPTLSVSGRDCFAPLCDSSAKPQSIRGLDFKQLAEKLSVPWSLEQLRVTRELAAARADLKSAQQGLILAVWRERYARNTIARLEPRNAPFAPWIAEWVVHNEKNRAKLAAAQATVARMTTAQEVQQHSHLTGKSAAEALKDLSPAARASVSAGEVEYFTKKSLAKMEARVAELRATVFPAVKVEPGETPLDVLVRSAAKIGFLVWATADGKGVIARPNYDQTPLYKLYLYPGTDERRSRNNIMRWQITDSLQNRFSETVVLGSQGSSGANFGAALRSEVSAIDTQVPYTRPKIMVDGDAKSLRQAKAKADREQAKRRFEGKRIIYTVPGHQQDGRFWQIDTIVSVDDQVNGVAGPHYITRRKFTRGEQGTMTELELREPGVWLA